MPKSGVSLADIQRQFSRYVLHGETDISDNIVSTSKLASTTRLGIYSYAYKARLIEALQTDYPILEIVMGEAAFERLAGDYIAANPSGYTSLTWFGQHLPEFIVSSKPSKYWELLHDLAALESHLAQAFNAADASIVALADMASLPPEAWPGLVLDLHPSVQLFDYHWNILPLWKAAKLIAADATAAEPEVTPERLEQSVTCLVWRNQLQTQFRSLDSEAALAIRLALRGVSFAQLCEELAQQADDPEQTPLRAAGMLKAWIESGMVAQLRY